MRKLILFLFASILIVFSAAKLYAEDGIFLKKDEDKIFLQIKIPQKNLKDITKRLSSGLTNKVIISVQIKDKKKNRVILEKSFLFEVVYDVWEEKFILSIFDPEKRMLMSTKDKNEIMNMLSNLHDIELCNSNLLTVDGIYQVKAKVVINPVSREIIEKIKEYLSDPELVQKESATRTIFGSFANTFIPEFNTDNSLKYEIKSLSVGEIHKKK